MDNSPQMKLPSNLTLHIGQEDALLQRAIDSPDAQELILSPVELHRRNIQRRLRESRTPQYRFEFTDPATLSERLLESVGSSTTTIDRIDRLSMIRSMRSEEGYATEPAVPTDPQQLEQVRTETESITGFHPCRVTGLRETTDSLAAPVDADAAELLCAGVEIERALRQRTEKAISDVELVRTATRELLHSDGDIWRNILSDTDRVSLVGISSIPAVHADLLHAIVATTAIPVDVYFRRGTGPYLERRLPDLLDVDAPGTVVFDS
ncbi:hypothetical protein [Halobacterium salinarum]|uniref:hypothetical protein n=1 Tax=Halobacterium salinarum TaxID=2242 RepID=UPI002557A59E|nr:hypothetical protein [Halobacterium salinarum]MDL0134750.1 hypothetical protein [Halobacterium salinarum]